LSHEFARLQAVVIIKIGCLGFLGAITAVNDNGVFGAILLSPLLGYDSTNKRSYSFDLRYALENSSTKQCIIFQPQTMDLEIYFIARNGTLADDPVFEAIDLDF
jgi:hypothetical protein